MKKKVKLKLLEGAELKILKEDNSTCNVFVSFSLKMEETNKNKLLFNMINSLNKGNYVSSNLKVFQKEKEEEEEEEYVFKRYKNTERKNPKIYKGKKRVEELPFIKNTSFWLGLDGCLEDLKIIFKGKRPLEIIVGIPDYYLSYKVETEHDMKYFKEELIGHFFGILKLLCFTAEWPYILKTMRQYGLKDKFWGDFLGEFEYVIRKSKDIDIISQEIIDQFNARRHLIKGYKKDESNL